MIASLLPICERCGFELSNEGGGLKFTKGSLSFYVVPVHPFTPSLPEIKALIFDRWHTLCHARRDYEASEVLALYEAICTI